MLSSMALVVAAPAARLFWLTRRIRPDSGKVVSIIKGTRDMAAQTTSGATLP